MLKKLLVWAMPLGLALRWEAKRDPDIASPIVSPENAALKDRHRGERAFILCTGPSIKALDLGRLEGELVISVSNAYLHPDFARIEPRYHCVPQITYAALTPSDAARWLREMHSAIGDAEVVLSSREKQLVRQHSLFRSRPTWFLDMSVGEPPADGRSLPDLTRRVVSPQSVPIMALSLALYLGCKEIILLGVQHDHFLTGEYKYFFDDWLNKGKDISTDRNGAIVSSRHDDFQALAMLWRQYRWVRHVAEANGVSIVNATPQTALDEFPRVDYAALSFGRAAGRRT